MRLNLGCGWEYMNGFINVDRSKHSKADVICDVGKLPFRSCCIEEIKAKMILEHVDDLIETMNELYRVLSQGGFINVMVPSQYSAMAIADPTHKRVFNNDSFGYFCSVWNGGINGRSDHYARHKDYGITCNFNMETFEETRDRRSGKIKTKLIKIGEC